MTTTGKYTAVSPIVQVFFFRGSISNVVCEADISCAKIGSDKESSFSKTPFSSAIVPARRVRAVWKVTVRAPSPAAVSSAFTAFEKNTLSASATGYPNEWFAN